MSDRIHWFQRSICSFALVVGAGGLEGAAPVATDDAYVVDEEGTITVRASFPDTVSALDPSLYWRFNDTNSFEAATTIDRGSDALSSNAAPTVLLNTHSAIVNRTSAPTLRSSNGFKGFADTNAWFGFGSAESGGAITNLLTPTSGWGSDMGAISFWFKTDSIGGDSTNESSSGAWKSPRAFFVGLSDYSVANFPDSFYRTAVLVGLVDGKVIFLVSENDVPIVQFLTTNTYNDSEWHHVVAFWDNAGDESGLLVDGGGLGGATSSETMKSFDFDLATDFDFSGYGVRVGKS